MFMMRSLFLIMFLPIAFSQYVRRHYTSVPDITGDPDVLDISHNMISEILPTDFTGLTGLVELTLSINRITTFPDFASSIQGTVIVYTKIWFNFVLIVNSCSTTVIKWFIVVAFATMKSMQSNMYCKHTKFNAYNFYIVSM